MTAEWEGLAGALGGIPELPGARCAGLSEVFDETDDPELIEYAKHLCRSCPALVQCRSWVESLKKNKRPIGTIAGSTAKELRALKETA